MINSVAALVPQIVIEIGALAGLASFLGVTTLAILTFVQGRDLRRLRDWAGRAPERDAEFQEATAALAADRAEEMRNAVEELPHGDPLEAEARAVQLRAARQRNREEGIGPRLVGSRVAQILAGVLAVAAVAGVTYFAIGQLGGDDEPAQERAAERQKNRRNANNRGGAIDPSQIQVAVLNGTAASGLATSFQDGVSTAGYQVGAVGNSQSTFSESTVMFVQGHRPEAAALARQVGISRVEPMIEEINVVAEGASLAVVLGEDKIPAG